MRTNQTCPFWQALMLEAACINVVMHNINYRHKQTWILCLGGRIERKQPVVTALARACTEGCVVP